MKEIVNKFLLAENDIMTEIHFWQPAALGKPGLTYSACRTFTKNKEGLQKFKETGDS